MSGSAGCTGGETTKVRQLVIGAVNPRLTQFTAAFALALGIGAVVLASIVGFTLSITSQCQTTCSGLPLYVAAEDGGRCRTAFVEDDLIKLPTPPITPFWSDIDTGTYRSNYIPRNATVEKRDGMFMLELTNINGTFSKDFDFSNFQCILPKAQEFTRMGWSVATYRGVTPLLVASEADGYGRVGVSKEFMVPSGTTSCAGYPTVTDKGPPQIFDAVSRPGEACNEELIGSCKTPSSQENAPQVPYQSPGFSTGCSKSLKHVHWMHADAVSSTRFQISPGRNEQAFDDRAFGSLSCCKSTSGVAGTFVPAPSSGSTNATKDWFEAQLLAEEEAMGCIHFNLKIVGLRTGYSGLETAIDNTLVSTGNVFSPKSLAELQAAANLLTSSNPKFVKRMNHVREKSYVYCCKDICPTVTAALGSALGYANYIEVLFTVLAIFIYMRMFGGTMTEGNGNGKPMTFKEMMTIAQEDREAWQK
jgi:hypothetical protein